MNRIKIFSGVIFSFLVLGHIQIASAVVDPTAEKVALKKSCSVNGGVVDNCFTTFLELAQWLKNTRKPNAGAPIQVDIGAGIFAGSTIPGTDIYVPDINIYCKPSDGYTGYISFKGQGANQSVLQGTGSGSTSAVNISNCTELSFSDLKVTTSFYGGVYWKGGGNSRWTNVDFITNGRAWDEPVCGDTRGNHYWFSSRISTTSAFTVAVPYKAACDETWFFGSEVKLIVPDGELAGGAAVTATGNGIIHLYGSNLRNFFDGEGVVPAAEASNGGEIHIHGTGIDSISETGKDIYVLKAESGGLIHADVSAYVMQTTGNKTRILNNGGIVKAPYQWGQSNQPPQVISEDGADMAVETNCEQSVCHDIDTGTETHLLIYNESCTGTHGPWFDVVTRKCRGQL